MARHNVTNKPDQLNHVELERRRARWRAVKGRAIATLARLDLAQRIRWQAAKARAIRALRSAR